MRYKYCPKCRKAYIKSRVEGDKCIYCGVECEMIDVKRNRLYYFGYAIMLMGATSAFIPRFMNITGESFFIYFGIALVIAGSIFVVMGSTAMARTAVQMALLDKENNNQQ